MFSICSRADSRQLGGQLWATFLALASLSYSDSSRWASRAALCSLLHQHISISLFSPHCGSLPARTYIRPLTHTPSPHHAPTSPITLTAGVADSNRNSQGNRRPKSGGNRQTQSDTDLRARYSYALSGKQGPMNVRTYIHAYRHIYIYTCIHIYT